MSITTTTATPTSAAPPEPASASPDTAPNAPPNAPPNASPNICPIDHAALAQHASSDSDPSPPLSPTGCPVSARAAAFDPFEAAWLQDPPDYVRWAREQEPVFYAPRLGYWVVTRYADIQAVFRDNLTYSPCIALEKVTPNGDAANAVLKHYGYAMERTMVNEDEPSHMLRRRLLIEPFTPQAVIRHAPMVRRLTRTYMDRFIDEGRADLVDQILWKVPLTVALHFLGVAEDDMELLRQYSIAHTVNTWGRPRPEEQVAVAHAVGNFWQLAGGILDKMRQNPDAPGWMQYSIRQQKDHPEIVTDSYLHSMLMAGVVAAHETTANASANALKLLLSHPDAWQAICDDPGLIPNAVEECLRHAGSIIAWRRQATRDAAIAGVRIPAGARLLIIMASANMDEQRFADADGFDIRRENASDHLSFGFGAHQCMGKNLARMEMQIFLQEFTRRLPHMRLARQHFTYLPNTSFRGPEHLWVEWNPAHNPERARADGPSAQAAQTLQAVQTAGTVETAETAQAVGTAETAEITAQTPATAIPSTIPPAPPPAIRLGEPSAHAITRPLTVRAVTAVAEDVVELTLAAPDGGPLPRWTPGAHIDIECGSTGLSRQYSLCGDPADVRTWRIAVLKDPASRGGSAWLHAHVKPGSVLHARGPRSHFRLDEKAPRALFIAGGIGITPIAAMARRARALGLDYALHYSARTRASMAYLNELRALHGPRLHVHISSEGEGERNDLNALLADPAAHPAGTQVYACGPLRMLDGLQAAMHAWPADALRIEQFQSAARQIDPSQEHAFEAELQASGITVTVAPGQTLLAALRAANIDVQSDCEEGLCGSCEVKVLSGDIDHRDAVLTRAERATGERMMVCCSRAKGRKVVLAL